LSGKTNVIEHSISNTGTCQQGENHDFGDKYGFILAKTGLFLINLGVWGKIVWLDS
jgi:uncharacterized membrane protein